MIFIDMLVNFRKLPLGICIQQEDAKKNETNCDKVKLCDDGRRCSRAQVHNDIFNFFTVQQVWEEASAFYIRIENSSRFHLTSFPKEVKHIEHQFVWYNGVLKPRDCFQRVVPLRVSHEILSRFFHNIDQQPPVKLSRLTVVCLLQFKWDYFKCTDNIITRQVTAF